MVFRVAVASSDGKVVNQHFGHSEQFFIFDVKAEGDYSLLEIRKTAPPCSFGEHDQGTLENAVNLLSDCNYVLCYQIGRGAEYELEKKGIRAFVIGNYIETGLSRLWKAVNSPNQ
jgi:predicted Fe-Mo cluster-binding NifX family protein